MRPTIDEELRRRRGVATRTQLLRVVSETQFDDEVRRGRLVRPFRRAYCRPWDADLGDILKRAALTSVGPPAALTHLTSLRSWELWDGAAEPVHVTVPDSRMSRLQAGLVVHRAARFPAIVRLRGLPTSTAAAAVVESWPLLERADRRGPAIAAVRTHLVTPEAVQAEVAKRPRLAGRRDLLSLLGLLAAGCESELEIWGHLHVFDVPGLRHAVRQKAVRAGGRTYRLDHAYEEERVAVEMDGERFYSTRDQRERDRVRDAALATIGWVTLRFSHERLHRDVAGCRRDTLATLAARRP